MIFQNYAIATSETKMHSLQKSHRFTFFPRKKKKKEDAAAVGCICRAETIRRIRRRGRKKKFLKITISISVNRSITPVTTTQRASSVLGRSSYMQPHTYLRKGNTKTSASSARCCKASVSFVSVLSDFLVSHFYELVSLLSEARETKD